jgi:lysophospholipase L1-like esterase
LCHRTCGPLHGDLPDLKVLVDGRPGLGGPLRNLGLGREDNYYMIAAGKGWHAGARQLLDGTHPNATGADAVATIVTAATTAHP